MTSRRTKATMTDGRASFAAWDLDFVEKAGRRCSARFHKLSEDIEKIAEDLWEKAEREIQRNLEWVIEECIKNGVYAGFALTGYGKKPSDPLTIEIIIDTTGDPDGPKCRFSLSEVIKYEIAMHQHVDGVVDDGAREPLTAIRDALFRQAEIIDAALEKR